MGAMASERVALESEHVARVMGRVSTRKRREPFLEILEETLRKYNEDAIQDRRARRMTLGEAKSQVGSSPGMLVRALSARAQRLMLLRRFGRKCSCEYASAYNKIQDI